MVFRTPLAERPDSNSRRQVTDVSPNTKHDLSLVVSGNKERVISSGLRVKKCLQPLTIVISPVQTMGGNTVRDVRIYYLSHSVMSYRPEKGQHNIVYYKLCILDLKCLINSTIHVRTYLRTCVHVCVANVL